MDVPPRGSRGLIARSILWMAVVANSAVALSSPVAFGAAAITFREWIFGSPYPGRPRPGEVLWAVQTVLLVSLGLYLVLGYWRSALGRLDARSERRLWTLSLVSNVVAALVSLSWGGLGVVVFVWTLPMCVLSAYQWAVASQASLSGATERFFGRRRGWEARRASRRAHVVNGWDERPGPGA